MADDLDDTEESGDDTQVASADDTAPAAQPAPQDSWPGQEWPGTEQPTAQASGGDEWPGQEWPGTEEKEQTGIGGAALAGLKAGPSSFGKGLLAGTGQGADIAPAAQPEFTGLPAKLTYGLFKSAPMLAGGILGGILGSMVEPVIGTLVGGASGAALADGVVALGDAYQENLQKLGDPDAAYKASLGTAAISGLGSGVSWAAFPAGFTMGPLKHLILQAGVVQPAVGVATQAAENVQQGKPVTQDLGETAAMSMLTTGLLMGGHAAVSKGAEAIRTPGRPDLNPSPEQAPTIEAEKSDAEVSQSPSVAGNNALAQQPAADPKTVNPDAQVAGTKVKAEGAQDGRKASVTETPTTVTTGDAAPDVMAALQESVRANETAPAPPEEAAPTPAPEAPQRLGEVFPEAQPYNQAASRAKAQAEIDAANRTPAPAPGKVDPNGYNRPEAVAARADRDAELQQRVAARKEPPPGRVNAEDRYGRYTKPAEPEYTAEQQAANLARIKERAEAAPKVETPPVAEPATPPATNDADIKLLTKLRSIGWNKAADTFENGTPQVKAAMRARLEEAAASKHALTRAEPEKVAAEKANATNKFGQQTGTVAKRVQQDSAIDAIAKAYESHPPVEGETTDQLVTRAQKAIQTAHEAHGSNPLMPGKGYKPRSLDPYPTFGWFKKIQDLAADATKGKLTEARADKFRADEAVLRSKNDEYPVKDTDAMAAGTEMSRRGGDVAEKAADRNATNPEDTIAAVLDAKKNGMSHEQIEEALANGAFDHIETEEQETAAKPVERKIKTRADLQSAEKPERPAAPVREIKSSEVSAEENARLLKESERAQKRDTQPPPDNQLTRFWDDQRAELNLDKIHQDWRATQTAIRAGLTKYIGVPWSDLQKRFDSVLIKGVTGKEQMTKGMRDTLAGKWRVWDKQATPSDVLKYLTTIEQSGNNTRTEMVKALKDAGLPTEKAEWMADEAQHHREVMQSIFEKDRELLKDTKGAYEAVENYVTHIFEDPKGAQKFIDDRIKNLGPTWFQKERSFDTIQAALDAGFKLKFKNPIDIIGARWKASINSAALLDTARGLMKEGMAYPVGKAPKGVDTDGWVRIGRLPDRQEWQVHPEGEYLWKNAMEAKGLAERDDVIGDMFRAWMKVKTVWTPIKLALSAFHAVHMVGIHFVRPLNRFLKQSFDDPSNVAKFGGQALKSAFAEPLLAMPLNKLPLFGKVLDTGMQKTFGTSFSTFEGQRIREMFGKDPKDMSPDDRMWVGLAKEAGHNPFQSYEDVIGAKDALAKALDARAPAGILWNGFRRGIEKIQDPLFKDMIPSLKYMAFKQKVSDLIARDPSLASDAGRRGEALREIAKNLDDTYGEMLYKGLFWNKTLKDIGIGTQLSMSWNLGQYRQLIGAARDVGKNIAGAVMQYKDTGSIKGATERYRTPSQLNKYKADDKMPFVASYVGTSMAISGLMSWALSGEFPTGLDYVFPRTSRKNADGTPQRLSPPFNTREPFQLMGHAQESNSWIGGLQQYLWNKMVLQPIVEVWNNKDFYGNKLWDDQAPFYKRVLQGADSVLGANLSPVTVSGADRAKREGGGLGGQALAYAGFAPAAKYLNNTALENRIAGAYYQTFGARPYEYGPKTGLGRGMVQGGLRYLAGDKTQGEARQEGTAALRQAVASGDKAAEAKARATLASREGGNMGKTAGRLDPANEHAYQFSKLGKGDIVSIGRDMDKADFERFVARNPNMLRSAPAKAARAELMHERGLL